MRAFGCVRASNMGSEIHDARYPVPGRRQISCPGCAAMKIALTSDPDLPVPPVLYGGIERVVDMVARRLMARGHEVMLFAHPQSTCPVPKQAWPGASSRSRLDTVKNAGKLAAVTSQHRFDIVHSFSRLAYLTPILARAIPKLMSYQRAISPRTTMLAHRLSRGTLEFSAISRHMLRDVEAIGTWHVVPNGVPLEAYDLHASVAADAPLVFLGRLEAIKGPHLAIEAARKAGRRLILAGNVPEAHRNWFASWVAPHLDKHGVSYIGPVNDLQKKELLGRASALLMPILWEEPFGIVMAEAMACGTPVIGFGRGAVCEVVETGKTGFVVDNLAEMVAAIANLDALDRRACRARVEALYSDSAVTDGYLHIYEKMVARDDPALGP